MGLSRFDHILWFTSAVLATLIIVRIRQQRLLVSPLNSFAWMLGAVVTRDALLSIPAYDTHAYAVLWELSLPFLLAAQLWAGYDTLRAVARLYPKIGKFAIRLFLTCLAVTVAVCCLTVPFELHLLQGGEKLLRALFLLNRSVDSWIAGTLILVSLFFARSPAPEKQPPRNLVLHTVLLSIYFGTYAVLFLAENLAPLGALAALERTQFFVVAVLYASWAISLSRGGEKSEPWPQLDVIVLETLHQRS